MKYTLLEMVTMILSAMDSDEVTSINDTTESKQVVEVVKSVYNDIVSRALLPEHKTLFQLVQSDSVLKPTVMTVPTDVDHVDWVKYNKIRADEAESKWNELIYLDLPEFLERFQNLTGPGSFTYDLTPDVDMRALNNKAPEYYTTFDDKTLVFDSYDAEVDDQLQGFKTLAFGKKTQTFTATDGWVAPLDAEMFSIFLNEAKALAFAELKQAQHAKAEKSARQGWIHLQNSKHRVRSNSLQDTPNYGRKR